MAYVAKVRVSYRNDNTGVQHKFPGILTQGGVLISHLRYLASRWTMSESWKEASNFAVRKLIEYLNAHEGHSGKTEDLLRGCARAFQMGTIDAETLSDPSDLYWSPRSEDDYLNLLAHLTSYTDWLSEQPEYKARRANPYRKANSVEERMNWCAYFNKQANVFLNHLGDREKASKNAQQIRSIRLPRKTNSLRRPTKRFPESEIDNLMVNGWVRKPSLTGTIPVAQVSTTEQPSRSKRRSQLIPAGTRSPTEHDFIDYKGRAITMLLHYGGIRKSEVFQLYLQDFIYDKKKGELIVRIYHPALGASPKKAYRNRREYLLREFGVTPRSEIPRTKALHAGWKAPMLDESGDNYFTVMFSPSTKAKEFMAVFSMYLKYQRVDPADGSDHPYAFTNTEGEPETLKNFNILHKAAVNRIGLEHCKTLGTTEHGHRHAYGYRLAELGMTQQEIKIAMHHKSIHSCLVYIERTEDDVRESMQALEQKKVRASG